MDIYELARGPLAWVSILIFIFGSLSRIIFLLYSAKTEPVLNLSQKNRAAVRSILYGIIPFSSITMRRQPFLTITTFTFHICVLLLPIFLLAHTVLWYESLGNLMVEPSGHGSGPHGPLGNPGLCLFHNPPRQNR